MPGIRRGLVALLATTMAVFMLSGTALAQEPDYPAEEDGGSASGPATVVQGAEATFTGRGFEPGAEVLGVVLIAGDEVARQTLMANDGGVVTMSAEIPCTAMKGDQGTAQFTGPDDEGGEEITVSEDFTVAGEAPGCPEGLPTTGAEVSNGLLLAIAVIALGGGLLLYSRRRNKVDETVES